MKYIINGNLKYNSVDGSLYLSDHSMDMVTLNRVTSELLFLLIDNNSMPLSRDTILNELWVKRGLNASSNNLNNYVSILRKALAHCGHPDLIKTIPKYGFVLEADITLVERDECTQPETTQGIGQFDASGFPKLFEKIEAIEIERPIGGYLTRKKKKVLLILLALIILWIPPIIYNEVRNNGHRTEVLYIGQCKIYLTDNATSENERLKVVQAIKNIIKNEGLKCERDTTMFYFADTKSAVTGNEVSSDLLTYCPDNSHSTCINYHLSAYLSKNDR